MHNCLAVILALALPHIGAAQIQPNAVPWVLTQDFEGGISGLDIPDDGQSFVAVGDNGFVYEGRFERGDAGQLVGVTGVTVRPVMLEDGRTKGPKRHRDTEAISFGTGPDLWIAIEGDHRVLHYASDQPRPRVIAIPPSDRYRRNAGFEAMAIDPQGALIVLPEASASLRTPFPILRYTDEDGWQTVGGLPRSGGFRPVGADLGPDGALYVLSRAFSGFAFASRVDRVHWPITGQPEITRVFESAYGQFDNLEGLATWRDAQGVIWLTMVSDDNFSMFQTTQFVEVPLRNSLR